MAQMLRHKETGELFIWTSQLSTLSELELVVEDPVAVVIAEMAAQVAAVEDAQPIIAEEVELPVLGVVSAPAFVEVPSFIETPVEPSDSVGAMDMVNASITEAKPSVTRATTKSRARVA